MDETIQERSEDIDETMIEMSIDEHPISKPQKLPVPILTTKSNAVVAQDKEEQLELLRNQLHLNKELIERNSSKLCPSQI